MNDPRQNTPGQRPNLVAAPSVKPDSLELDPIELVEGPQSGPTPASKIKAFGQHAHVQEHAWKRQPNANSTGSVRVKSFHGKYSDQGLEYLDNAINDWLDSHPNVEVKFVTSTVGVFEGKIREPALVLNLWY
jgi:ABC-type glycerol-3-phosphate transport system substrate-binding protein